MFDLVFIIFLGFTDRRSLAIKENVEEGMGQVLLEIEPRELKFTCKLLEEITAVS